MYAAIYLRVSTVDQATRGNAPEGFSIPAQRDACRKKASQLGVTDIREYVDRGQSARTADRPALQALLRDVRSGQTFDYVIVHKIDRLARSVYDDASICLEIQRSGGKLVSVTENIDETPTGQLMHVIMAGFSEYYSRNLAAEALKGATQKAKKGGTPYRAPIGYLNVIERTNDRESRLVRPDPERAHIIRWAFECYSTGDYSLHSLAVALKNKGLVCRPNGKTPVGPLSKNHLGRVLTNRYYLGYVHYMGHEYRGTHIPLVSPSTFAAVQAILENRGPRSSRHSISDHYLKDLLFCGDCDGRLGFTSAKGGRFEYYYCLNRQAGTGCPQPYVPVSSIERIIRDRYRCRRLTPAQRAALTAAVEAELAGETRFAHSEVLRQQAAIRRLLATQEQTLQAFYLEAISPELLKQEQDRIEADLVAAKKLLQQAEHHCQHSEAYRAEILELVSNLDLTQAYRSSSPAVRRRLNQAFFKGFKVTDTNRSGERDGYRRAHYIRVVSERRTDLDISRLTQAVLIMIAHRRESTEP